MQEKCVILCFFEWSGRESVGFAGMLVSAVGYCSCYNVAGRWSALPAAGWGSNVLCSDFVDEYQVCLGAVLLMGVDVAFDDSHVVFVLQGLPSAIVL